MTQETRTVIESREIEVNVDKEKVAERKCDNCNQWYKEDETEWHEYTKNASVENPVDRVTFSQLLDLLQAYKVFNVTTIRTVVSDETFRGGLEMTEERILTAIIGSVKNFKHKHGTPQLDSLSTIKTASSSSTRGLEELEEDEYVFELDLDLSVLGEKRYLCDHCDEVIFNG